MTQFVNWTTEFFAWADENHISVEKLPRDEETLLSQTALNLSFCKLTQLPESLANLTHLTELDLAYNELTEIPEWIDNFTALEKLDVSGNSITSLPDSLRHLPNLVLLGLDKQQVKKFKNFGKFMATAAEDIAAAILIIIGHEVHRNEISERVLKTKLSTLGCNGGVTPVETVGKFLSGNKKGYFIRHGEGWYSASESAKNSAYLQQLTEKIRERNFKKTTSNVQNTPSSEVTNFEQPKTKMKNYQQKILFGSPGTGKSYKIDKQIISNDLKITNSANVIKTVFHPEYTYGDFVGKLMPITVGGNVQYKFYEGHFLKALSQAYKNIIAAQDNDGEIEKVALVIDEINRGNSAAIFGTIFQLLDRNPDGWSSYEVSVNEIIFNRLLELCDLTEHANVKGKIKKVTSYLFGEEEIKTETLQKKLNCHFENRTIKIPPNLSILASMNTSDSSIYYMDSAFKRRWEWEFIDINGASISDSSQSVEFSTPEKWIVFVDKLNAFIKSKHQYIRGIEDKQIGHFFIRCTKEEPILKSSIQNKLMFFLWDSVFNRDKKPLIELLDSTPDKLVTFGDFAKEVDLFIEKINER